MISPLLHFLIIHTSITVTSLFVPGNGLGVGGALRALVSSFAVESSGEFVTTRSG